MKKNSLRIGLGQIELTDNWDRNRDSAFTAYKKLAGEDCQFSIFPELWPSAFGIKNAAKFAKRNCQNLIPDLMKLTGKNQFYSHWGTLLHQENEVFHNRAIIFDPQGDIALIYDKVHLFGLMNEDQYLSPGSELTIMDTPWGKVATAICYDLRFPELFRYYALGGVKIIFLPAQWPQPRLNHWRQLIQARAIENQVFMVACNAVGKRGNLDFFGHSMIVDPWGEILYEANESPSAEVVEVDLSAYENAKNKLNTVQDIDFRLFQKMMKWDKNE